MSRTNFIHINEGFTCLNCNHKNVKSQGSCRNHCSECLYSLHVDETVPGDRESGCHSLMIPIAYSQNSKKGYIIKHMCQKCSKTINNKMEDDDNYDTLIKYISTRMISPF